MSDLVGNPEDQFSHNETHIMIHIETYDLLNVLYLLTFIVFESLYREHEQHVFLHRMVIKDFFHRKASQKGQY